MPTPPSEWLQALACGLASRDRFPKFPDDPEHRDATPEMERRLEREIARRLGRRRRSSSTC